ncbi:hypothetical protein Anas_13222, partial [Armadillidium nasatum]
MQIKMQETTPKAIKKTPKKVKDKETPLKKGGISVTPKATANTPKSAKKSPKPDSNSTPKLVKKTPKPNSNGTPKAVKKTPKPNSNGTPKEVKDQQKKTPQKNKKPVQENGNKTPQSEPITPKTPESGSKKKQKPRHRSIKKQKLEDGESKEIITDSAGKENEKSALKSDKSTPGLPLITISPPRGIAIPSTVIQQIFEESEHVTFNQHTSFSIKYKQDVVLKKMEELQNIKINGRPLRFRQNIRKHHLLKKTVRLMNADDQEKVQKFYNAKSIENLISRWGAPTKKQRQPQKRSLIWGDESLTLLPYYQNNRNEPSGDGKVKSDKQVQKQETDTTKQTKNVQVESKKQEQKKKLNVAKQSKNAQVKRKADEDEEGEEEEEEDEEEEFDFDGEIDMGDDDDDEDDDD